MYNCKTLQFVILSFHITKTTLRTHLACTDWFVVLIGPNKEDMCLSLIYVVMLKCTCRLYAGHEPIFVISTKNQQSLGMLDCAETISNVTPF